MVTVAVTYTFVVDTHDPDNHEAIGEQVREHIDSDMWALDYPDKVVEV